MHPGQREVKSHATRFNVLACGRRWGKTLLGQDVLIQPTLKGWPVAWFAPTYKLLIEAWREILRALYPIMKRNNATERRIELRSGGVLDFWTLEDPDAGRSRKYKRVFIDEAALVPNLGEIWHASIRPTLADMQGDTFMGSTPKGRNFFWQCWQKGQDASEPEWTSWQKPTHDNPHILPSEIEAMRAAMPERLYRQEVLAEFLEDGGGVFRSVASLATLEPQARANGGQYVGGIDWARSNDYTVLSVIDARTKKQVALDRFSQVEYETQLHRFQAMHERFKVGSWLAEENAMGGPLVERLQREGYPVQGFTTTNTTKSHLIDGLALAFERGELTLLDDPTQTAELQAYEMERLPSGMIRYGAPEGMHDDCVIALALAWQAATHTSRGIYL